MKKNYVTPSLELIEIEIEDAVLQTSNIENFSKNNTAGSGLNDW